MLNSIAPWAAFVALLALPLAYARPDAPCYDPGKTVAPGYYACDQFAPVSNCCPQGWTCFSNALCIVTTPTASFPNLTLGAVVRGMCTNPLWNNEICGDHCLSGDNIDGELVYCGNHQFCCLGDYNAGVCDCSSGGNSFLLNDGTAQTIVGETETFSGTPSIATTRPTASPSKSSSRPASNTARPTTSSTAPPSGSPTDTGSPPEGGDNKLGLKVGIPVGVIGGLALIGGLIFAFLRWKRNRTGVNTNYYGAGGSHNPGPAEDTSRPNYGNGYDTRENPFASGREST